MFSWKKGEIKETTAFSENVSAKFSENPSRNKILFGSAVGNA